jgi:hypothetical protein
MIMDGVRDRLDRNLDVVRPEQRDQDEVYTQTRQGLRRVPPEERHYIRSKESDSA